MLPYPRHLPSVSATGGVRGGIQEICTDAPIALRTSPQRHNATALTRSPQPSRVVLAPVAAVLAARTPFFSAAMLPSGFRAAISPCRIAGDSGNAKVFAVTFTALGMPQ